MANQTELRSREEESFRLTYSPIERLISVTNPNGTPFTGIFKQASTQYPVRAVVDINSVCNARCEYCSQADKHDGPSLTKDEVLAIIDELEEMKVFELTLRGGEASIHPDFNEIWRYATTRNFLSTNIITNGINLTEDRVTEMIENPKSKLIISLDGPDVINSVHRDPRQYTSVMAWLQKFLPEHQDQFVILSTLYRENLPHIPDFASFLSGIGLKHYHVTTLKRMGGSEFKKAGFVDPTEVTKLEKVLDNLARVNPNFIPMISCRYSRGGKIAAGELARNPARLKSVKETVDTESINPYDKLITAVPMPWFTDYHSGTGLKLTSDGNVGISKVVFFTNYFKETVGERVKTSLEAIGNIRDGRGLKDIWDQGLELRVAQGKIIDRNYEYYVGWESIENVT